MATDAPRRWPLLLIALASAALYAGSLRAGFVYDDAHTILRNPGVTGPFSLRAIFARDFWGEPLRSAESLGSYRPVTTLTFWLDHHLGHGSPVAFHVDNLALFAALLIALDRLLRAWLGGALDERARALALATFAVLATHTEVVSNATGRAEILALLFSAIALTAALAAPRVGSLATVAIVLVLAMGSKESAYPIALLAPVLAYRAGEPGGRARAAKVGAVSTIVLLGALILRARLIGRFGRDDLQMHFDNPLVFAPFGRRVLGGLEVVTHYLQHTATGIDLCPDYSYSAISLSSGPSMRSLIGVAFYAAGLFGLVASWRRRPRLAEAIAGFFAAYVAVSQMLLPAIVLVADRLFFAPSFFLVVVAALLVGAAIERRGAARARLVGLVAAAFVAEQALMSALLEPAWRTNLALTSYGVRTCPNVIRLRIERIHAARAAGQIEEGAWNALAAATLLSQYPRPVDDDFLPAEEQPFEERVVALQRKLGPAFGGVRAQAAVIAENVRYPEAVRALGGR